MLTNCRLARWSHLPLFRWHADQIADGMIKFTSTATLDNFLTFGGQDKSFVELYYLEKILNSQKSDQKYYTKGGKDVME